MWYFKTVAKFGIEWVRTGIYVPESKNDRCFQKKDRFGGGGAHVQTGAEMKLPQKARSHERTRMCLIQCFYASGQCNIEMRAYLRFLSGSLST